MQWPSTLRLLLLYFTSDLITSDLQKYVKFNCANQRQTSLFNISMTRDLSSWKHMIAHTPIHTLKSIILRLSPSQRTYNSGFDNCEIPWRSRLDG